MRPQLLIAGAFLALAGCDDDQLDKVRPDSGVAGRDAGILGPLPLTAGMAFSYQATLTRRGETTGEANAVYRLDLTIDSVDDQQGAAPSTLAFSATGQNMLAQDWSEQVDFDSWVARVGPALRSDMVSAGAVTAQLHLPPTLPPAPSPPPKQLPSPLGFFIDVRAINDIRAEFAKVYKDMRPRVVSPEMNNGRWLFSFEGMDSSIFYYPDAAKYRKVSLEYDPKGFLMRIDEIIGDVNDPQARPRASCRLMLTSGP